MRHTFNFLASHFREDQKMKESKRISVAEDNKILSKKNLDLQTRYDSLMKEAMGMRVAFVDFANREIEWPEAREAIASFDRLLRANGN